MPSRKTPTPEIVANFDSLGSGLEVLLSAWRFGVLGALLGLITAFIGFKAFAPSTVTLTVSNACVERDSEKAQKETGRETIEVAECALTLQGLAPLLNALPSLSAREGKGIEASSDQTPTFIRSPGWWEKHVVPVYGLSQAETKKFLSLDSSLKAESTRIRSLQINTSDAHPDVALEQAERALQWLRNGATLLDLRELLALYESERLIKESRLAQESLRIQKESSYLKDRITHLRGLLALEKDNTPKDQTRVTVGSVDTAFLPLRTQIHAAEVALTDLQERRRYLEDQATAQKVLRDFAERARPILDSSAPGTSATFLRDQLLTTLDQHATTKPDATVSGTFAVERIRGDILQAVSRYTLRLPEVSRQITRPALSLGAALTALILGALLGYFGFWLRSLRDRG